MRKTTLMASAAFAALVAAMGSANAADIMTPVVVPVITPAPVPVPGPLKVVRVDTTLVWETDSLVPLRLESTAGIDVRTASGWGFQFVAANTLSFDGTPFDGTSNTLSARVYRGIGAGTVGVFANASFIDLGLVGVSVGIDADYKTDTTELFYALGGNFFGGGFDSIQSIFSASLERGNFQIDVLSITTVPALSVTTIAKLGYSLGPITPYVRLIGAFDPPVALGIVGAGLDLEQDVGERLTLTANAEIDLVLIGGGGGLVWRAQAGFEYALGANDGPLSIHGNIGTGTGGGVSLELGLGLKFGGGRVTGIGGVLFDGVPGLDFLL